MAVKRFGRAFCALVFLCGLSYSQSTTGTLLGIVADPSDAAVPGAQVELRNTATGAMISTTTEAEGIFRFNSLVPATYNLTVKAPAGLQDLHAVEHRGHRQRGPRLGEDHPRRSGTLTEQVSVTAATTLTQTASSENSKLIDQSQMANITLKGRDMFGMMVTLPGVNAHAARHHQREHHRLGPHQRRRQRQRELHGGWHHQSGHRLERHFPLRAEHGFHRRNARPDQQLPGGVRPQLQRRDQRRHQGRQPASSMAARGPTSATRCSMPRASSRTTTASRRASTASSSGATRIGGPVYIPKLFNTRKHKLFFFWSQEYTKQKPATQSGYANMPTLGAARRRFLRLHRRQRRAVRAHRPHHRESGSGQQHRRPGRFESGGGQGRPGDAERPALAEYLRPLRRRRLRLHSWTPSTPPSNTSAITTGASTRPIRAATTPSASITTSPRS